MKLDNSEQKAAIVEMARGMICVVNKQNKQNKTEHCIATDMLLQVAMGNVCYVIIVICTTFGRKKGSKFEFL